MNEEKRTWNTPRLTKLNELAEGKDHVAGLEGSANATASMFITVGGMDIGAVMLGDPYAVS